MNIQATFAGLRSRVWASRYLLREIIGLPRIDRNQKLTQDGFEKFFGREIRQLKRQTTRIARVEGEFRQVTTIELEIESIRTHMAGLEALLGSRSATAEVLEVGAGYGRTLIPLSILMPNASFTGIEYTTAGPDAARRYWNEARNEIESIAAALGKVHAKDPPWKDFIAGDGKTMPYADQSFDVAYTNLVLEQIPYRADNERVVREMRRVVRKGACFLEPWANAQSILNKAYIRQNGYFRETTQLLNDVGFRRVEYRTLEFQHNLLFRLGYAIAYV